MTYHNVTVWSHLNSRCSFQWSLLIWRIPSHIWTAHHLKAEHTSKLTKAAASRDSVCKMIKEMQEIRSFPTSSPLPAWPSLHYTKVTKLKCPLLKIRPVSSPLQLSLQLPSAFFLLTDIKQLFAAPDCQLRTVNKTLDIICVGLHCCLK